MSLSVCRSAALHGFVVLLIFLIPVKCFAQPTVPSGFEDSSVAVVPYPTALAFVPDGRLLIAAMQGQIYVWQNGSLVPDAALDLAGRVCAYRERGLVGLAVDPEFTFNHFVYVSYSFDKYGACDAEQEVAPVGRVSRFQLGDDNRIVIDCNGFRKDKDAEIKQMALHMLEKARSSGMPQEMGPLNPYERRIVHMAIAEDPIATSESIGDAFMKTVIISTRK